MWRSIIAVGTGVLAVATAGCAGPDTIMPGFGEANARNASLQIVDPDPAYAATPPDYDGRKIIDAYGRYRTDTIKAPQPIGTTEVSGQ